MTESALKTLAAFLVLAIALAQTPAAGADALVSGSDYVFAAISAGAAPPGSGQAASPSSGDDAARYLDIAGVVTGRISGAGRESVMITGEGEAYLVRVESGVSLPSGALVRVLARVEYDGHRTNLELERWAYASDVTAAIASGAEKKAASARKAGASVSRGGQATRFDHTSYFDDYSKAIAGFNPRLSDAQVRAITTSLLDTSRATDTDPRLIMAVILAESHFNPRATSPKGAMGLGQLMPATARRMGLSDPYDVSQNVDACVKIIRSGLNKYSGNAKWDDLNWDHLRLALAAYNAGSGAVRKYGGVPPYRETKNYVAKVTGYYKQLAGIK